MIYVLRQLQNRNQSLDSDHSSLSESSPEFFLFGDVECDDGGFDRRIGFTDLFCTGGLRFPLEGGG